MINVGVVGYGTIGKRVADAILLQDDMDLVGITQNTDNYRIRSAKEKGIRVFDAHTGDMDDLLSSVDIVVDCTPKNIDGDKKGRYLSKGVKAIFQGGESADIGQSFVAQCNYDELLNEDYIRVVSCNTTGLCRTLGAIDDVFGIEMVHATMIRRAADPWDIRHGPINAIVPTLSLPSHHGPDVRTVIPHLNIFTTSVSVPTTLMHMHSLTIDLEQKIEVHEAVDLLNSTSRVRMVRNSDGIRSTAEIMEYAKDLGRSRGDMPEVCVWEDAVGVFEDKLFYLQAVHQESDVVPETVDAIRASVGACSAEESISKTNLTMGIR